MRKNKSAIENFQKRNVLLLCMFLTPLMGLGLDLYTPSLPAITSYFNVSAFSAKLTIIFYIAGYGIALPFVGIVSDHAKRKSFIVTALAIYFISSCASAGSPSIGALYCYRIINSICAACISVVLRSIIADNFSGKSLAKANNYYTMSWSLTPMIAPVIGGYLQHYLKWQANFYFMALYSFVSILLCLYLLDAQSKKRINIENFRLKNSAKRWKILFSYRLFLASVFILSVANALLFLYYTVAPFIIQKTLHFNAAQYGEIMLLAGVSYVLGNLLNDRLLNYFSLKKLIGAGLIVSLIVIIISMALLKFLLIDTTLSIYMVTIPVFLVFLCDGLIFANIITNILPRYSQFSGTATGLMAGLLNLIAAVIVSISERLCNLHYLINLNMVYFIFIGI